MGFRSGQLYCFILSSWMEKKGHVLTSRKKHPPQTVRTQTQTAKEISLFWRNWLQGRKCSTNNVHCSHNHWLHKALVKLTDKIRALFNSFLLTVRYFWSRWNMTINVARTGELKFQYMLMQHNLSFPTTWQQKISWMFDPRVRFGQVSNGKLNIKLRNNL